MDRLTDIGPDHAVPDGACPQNAYHMEEQAQKEYSTVSLALKRKTGRMDLGCAFQCSLSRFTNQIKVLLLSWRKGCDLQRESRTIMLMNISSYGGNIKSKEFHSPLHNQKVHPYRQMLDQMCCVTCGPFDTILVFVRNH